ncbi:hypothetical protein [Virgibacillus sp. SK37]|uniref:hypothetical protein n=1 Tax=Virgibacillus sp. SK37 TaxID=403957 RepID=UPI0011A898D2|nr:hypothetical protein [Virgibacillus sp. SK37]
MNEFEIVIKEWYSAVEANEGVNDFIDDCNDNDVEIFDITSHVTENVDGCTTYVFVFKVES